MVMTWEQLMDKGVKSYRNQTSDACLSNDALEREIQCAIVGE